MTDFRILTDDVWASPQLTPADVSEAADRGVTLIVNNRPEGEQPDQPTGAEIEAAAREAGVAYAAVPIQGRPRPDQAAQIGDLLARNTGKALMYCRSGMRSTAAWAMAATASGAISAEDARALAASAGYDLSGLPL